MLKLYTTVAGKWSNPSALSNHLLSTVFDVAMVRATAERGPRGGLLYHSHSYSSFSPPNLLLGPMEFGIRDIMYTSIEILDDLMYYIKYLRIYKKIETNRVFKMNKKSVKA